MRFAVLLFLPMTTWAKRSDPIIGTWNVAASMNKSPLFIEVITFHEGGTLAEFDTDGTNSSASKSVNSGVWKNRRDAIYDFKAENYAYDSSGKLAQIAVPVCQLILDSNQNRLNGTGSINWYN
jgi:hypothetical protein